MTVYTADTSVTFGDMLLKAYYGRWVSFPNPESPTGFFRPYLHGQFINQRDGKVQAKVLAGQHKGFHWVEKADVGGSNFQKAALSYAPIGEMEALSLIDCLTPAEVEALGEMMDAGELDVTPASDWLSNPKLQVMASLGGALALTFLAKKK
jgi:hypothetical protein